MVFPYLPTVPSVLAAQNGDGGWGYQGGGSWTEPTVYALLAQHACGSDTSSLDSGMRWLLGLQRPDGGWPPRASVDQSTWVTALVLLLLVGRKQPGPASRAAHWLLEQSGKEASFIQRLRSKLLGADTSAPADLKGWPWYPDTSAWVAPTALATLALGKYARWNPAKQLTARIESGRQFLLSRMCADGGWNHGSSHALGYDAGSYPETTGLALLALQAIDPSKLSRSYATAERHLRTCRSAEGLGWLQLGLQAHSRLAVPPQQQPAACRTVADASLCLLAAAALRGNNIFLG